MKPIVKPLLKAREIVVAARMPKFPKAYTGNPFTSLGDVVLDCDVPGCTWHAMGTREEAKKAWDEHSRFYHPEQVGVVRLNAPRQ